MRYPAVYQETILTRHRMWISVVTRIGGIIEIGISDKQFTSEMNNVHPTTRNTPVRSAYSTLFSTDTSFSSIRLSCHVISLPTCTIGADRPTRNNRNGSHRGGRSKQGSLSRILNMMCNPFNKVVLNGLIPL